MFIFDLQDILELLQDGVHLFFKQPVELFFLKKTAKRNIKLHDIHTGTCGGLKRETHADSSKLFSVGL